MGERRRHRIGVNPRDSKEYGPGWLGGVIPFERLHNSEGIADGRTTPPPARIDSAAAQAAATAPRAARGEVTSLMHLTFEEADELVDAPPVCFAMAVVLVLSREGHVAGGK